MTGEKGFRAVILTGRVGDCLFIPFHPLTRSSQKKAKQKTLSASFFPPILRDDPSSTTGPQV